MQHTKPHGHNGNLFAEAMDMMEPVSELHRILTEVQSGNTCGAPEAINFQLDRIEMESRDFRNKFRRGGFNQQTAIDVTPTPIAPKRGLWRSVIAHNVQGYRLRGENKERVTA